MRIRSVRQEMRILRICTVTSCVIAAAALFGASQAMRHVSFDTVTVHRINVIDREGKLAMVISSHDDEPRPVIRGYVGRREQGNNVDNGISFL